MDSGQEGQALDKLRRLLERCPPGPVEEPDEVIRALAECWNIFKGSGDQAMEARKVHRAEDAVWDPPRLSFTIERHGGTVKGSTRAEIQRWRVNIESAEADWDVVGIRQIRQRAPRWDARDAAGEIAEAILTGAEHPSLKRSADGRYQVRTSTLVPPGPKQAVEGRSQRLRRELEAILGPKGWVRAGAWWERAPSSVTQTVTRRRPRGAGNRL